MPAFVGKAMSGSGVSLCKPPHLYYPTPSARAQVLGRSKRGAASEWTGLRAGSALAATP